jgi:predicted RNA-binding Zn-ribbon protein involved in translation (DUF1610 family)
VSEFMLRFMAWLCLKDNALAGSQMCIVTGPRIDLAIALIDRMKKLLASSKGIAAAFDSKETVIELNGAKIEAFPSHHLDAMRGLPNVSFILLDEHSIKVFIIHNVLVCNSNIVIALSMMAGTFVCTSCKIKFQVIGISRNDARYCPYCGRSSIQHDNIILC